VPIHAYVADAVLPIPPTMVLPGGQGDAADYLNLVAADPSTDKELELLEVQCSGDLTCTRLPPDPYGHSVGFEIRSLKGVAGDSATCHFVLLVSGGLRLSVDVPVLIGTR
jgi:hypothetical protein